MGRRTVLLVVAAIVAIMGVALVGLYVRGADNRATEKQEPVRVLKAKAEIKPGETANEAMQASKLELVEVPRSQVLVGAMNSIGNIGTQVALGTIYPGEQIIQSKFGSPGDQSLLAIPEKQIAMSMSLSDTGRVAGFVTPGSEVVIFATCDDATHTLFDKMSVIAVGATTVTNTTTTDESGSSTTEQLPKTLFTLAVTQEQGQRLLQAMSTCELAYGLRTETSEVRAPIPPASAANLFR